MNFKDEMLNIHGHLINKKEIESYPVKGPFNKWLDENKIELMRRYQIGGNGMTFNEYALEMWEVHGE